MNINYRPKEFSLNTMGALQHGPGGPWSTQNFGWVGPNAFGHTNNWPDMFVNSLENLSDFKTRRDQIRFPPGLCPNPAGELTAIPPDPVFKGTTSKGKEEKGGDGKGEEEMQIRGKEQGGGRDLPHPKILA